MSIIAFLSGLVWLAGCERSRSASDDGVSAERSVDDPGAARRKASRTGKRVRARLLPVPGARVQAPPAPDDFVLSMKYECHLDCEYQVVIHADGRLEYHGKHGTVVTGTRSLEMPRERVNEVHRMLVEMSFMKHTQRSLFQSCEGFSHHDSQVTLQVTSGGTQNELYHGECGGSELMSRLDQMERYVWEFEPLRPLIERWYCTPEPRLDECYLAQRTCSFLSGGGATCSAPAQVFRVASPCEHQLTRICYRVFGTRASCMKERAKLMAAGSRPVSDCTVWEQLPPGGARPPASGG